jgi:predicted nucleic acid-binding protein
MTMAWCFPDEATAHTEAVFDSLQGDSEVFVPVLWPYEVTNVLLLALRKGRISSAQAREFVNDLEAMHTSVDDGTPHVWGKVFGLANAHRLTIYDAAYLELSMRQGLPLASLDSDLNKAAEAVGVALVTV